MLDIHPITDKHEQEALAARCRVPYESSCIAYAAFFENEPIALCQFDCSPFTVAKSERAVLITSIARAENTPLPPEVTEQELLRQLCIGVFSFCTQNGFRRFVFHRSIPDALPKSLGLHRGAMKSVWIW